MDAKGLKVIPVAMALCIGVIALAGCNVKPVATAAQQTQRPADYTIMDDPMQVRLAGAVAAAAAAATARAAGATRPDGDDPPPTAGPADASHPTTRPRVQAVGTVDDFITARLAQRLISPGATLPAVGGGLGGPPAQTQPDGHAAAVAGASNVAAEPSRSRLANESPGSTDSEPPRLVLPRPGDRKPAPLVSSMPTYSPPTLTAPATSAPEAAPSAVASAAKELPPILPKNIDDAPPCSAALEVGKRVFTGDEILRPIWGELERMAIRLPPDRHQREAMDLIAGQLKAVVGEHLVLQEAERGMDDHGRDAIQQAVNERLRDLAKDHGNSIRNLRQAWAHEKLDPDKEIDKIRQHLLVRAYFREKFTPQIHVSRPEAFAYYEKHMEEFSQDQRVRLKMIQVSPAFPSEGVLTAEARAKAIDNARDRASRILARIRSGSATFDQAAKDGDGRADVGPPITRGSLRAHKVDEAAFKLPVGQVGDVIEDAIDNNVSFYILLVTESTPLKVTPFSEAVNTIIPSIEQQKLNEESASYMQKLYREAGIDEQQFITFITEAYKIVTKPGRKN